VGAVITGIANIDQVIDKLQVIIVGVKDAHAHDIPMDSPIKLLIPIELN
jgi:hypothetical protein